MKEIHLWGVKQNNLKNIEIKIPLGKMTVVCGPSGSGKSSLAFQTLFAEGQRRFIESLSNYARQFLNAAPKPDIEGVSNIPPAVSIEQKNSVKNSRSTVGTTTEILDYFRLLYEKMGQAYCPIHQVPTSRESVTEATDKVLKAFSGSRGYLLVEVPEEGRVAQGKSLHSLILKEGYVRILLPQTGSTVGEVKEISSPAALKEGLPKDRFYLVIDRLSFSEEERGRLADSMAQAYTASLKFSSAIISRRALVQTAVGESLHVSEDNSCPHCDYQAPVLSTKLFSFNNPFGACPTCRGFGNILELDEQKVIPNPRLSLAKGALNPFTMPSAAQDRKSLMAYCRKKKIDVETPWEQLSQEHRTLLWEGSPEFMGVKGLFRMLEDMKYKMHVRVFISRYRSPSLCPDCKGSRLRKETQFVYFRGLSFPQLSAMTIQALADFFSSLKLTPTEQETAAEILHQIDARLNFLLRVGVHYLTLDRETRTLSGGEYQRLVLAHQLGMALSQTLYVLDEPTVGLHPRDNDRLISILNDLRDLGNTLVVVEHDRDVILSCDHIVEVGPGSGIFGGEIIFSGPIKEFWHAKNSITKDFLSRNLPLRLYKNEQQKPSQTTQKLTLRGAFGHNLKHIDVDIPLNRLVVVTGVSGSGKTTLITRTLYPTLCRALDQEHLISQPCAGIDGAAFIKNVVLLDQIPIGRSLRSNLLTFMKIYDVVRGIMASTMEAKQKSLTPGHFSLNVDGGRCPACKGLGFEEVDMVFMDNVTLKCEVCDGKKFLEEVLDVRFQNKNINEILEMTVEEALSFFSNYATLRKALSFLKEVGLEYLRLGQPANTYSGGESQRLKIAKELSQIRQKSTLYILDEPTTGLHFREVELLVSVLRRLIEFGSSVIVIEHNLDVVAQADHIIDLGPEGGMEGGHLVFQGSPVALVQEKSSLTGRYLAKHLKEFSS